MKLKTKQAKGFTLIELLVVIAIIAVLATLAAPAIIGALKKAKIAKSTGVCTAFEVAVNNFESEYNYLPYSGTSPDADKDIRSNDPLIAVLAGKEEEVNFKQIKFFTQPSAKAKKDGMDHDTDTLYDPWGETYYISIDYGLDDELTNPYGGDDINGKKCIMWSTGPDKESGSDGSTEKNRDNPSNFK